MNQIGENLEVVSCLSVESDWCSPRLYETRSWF